MNTAQQLPGPRGADALLGGIRKGAQAGASGAGKSEEGSRNAGGEFHFVCAASA